MARSSGRENEFFFLSFPLGSATEATGQGMEERGTQKGSSGRQRLLWLTTACLEELSVLGTAQPWGWGIFLTRSSFLKQVLGVQSPPRHPGHILREPSLLYVTCLLWIYGVTPHIPSFEDFASFGQAMSSVHIGRVLEVQPFILRWSKISREDPQWALGLLNARDHHLEEDSGFCSQVWPN